MLGKISTIPILITLFVIKVLLMVPIAQLMIKIVSVTLKIIIILIRLIIIIIIIHYLDYYNSISTDNCDITVNNDDCYQQ